MTKLVIGYDMVMEYQITFRNPNIKLKIGSQPKVRLNHNTVDVQS